MVKLRERGDIDVGLGGGADGRLGPGDEGF